MKLENASRWVEIAANVGVIVTLVLLVAEVRTNTRALQRQAFMDRSTALNGPFFEDPDLARILTGIKEVDGWGNEEWEPAFVDRYGMSLEDAVRWGRHLGMIWQGLEADYVLEGPSEGLASRVRLLLQFPDNELLWELGGGPTSNESFRAYVQGLRE